MPRPTLTGRLLRILLPILIILGAVLLAVMMFTLRPEPPSTPAEERVVPVQTMAVRGANTTFRIASQGTVQPRTETVLVAEVSGRVESVSDQLVAGGFIREGDVILEIESADYQVAVEQARAAVLTAEAQLIQEQAQAEQAEREWEQSGRPREDAPPLSLRTPFLREAEARVLQAEAELQRTRRQLARTTVRAPYDALIREKSADIGQYLNTGTQIARLFATDHFEVRLPLRAEDLAWLDLPTPGENLSGNEGAPVTLEASVAGKPRQWQARIVRTEGVVDSDSRMIHAVARVSDPYARQPENGDRPILRAGTFVNARLPGVASNRVFALPHHVLYNGDNVLVMDNERRLRIRPINILRTDTEYAYVDQGLEDGDRVITSPVQTAIDGMRVNPVEDGS
ncbi:MAG: efflux RND transporter periplasmic adaptor subunit [Pseudomonadota bacterium]